MSKLERWQKPFKGLPLNARWVAADGCGSCYWYRSRPLQVSVCSIPRLCCWGFTSPNLGTTARFGFLMEAPAPRDWRTAIRAVEPSERVKTKKGTK